MQWQLIGKENAISGQCIPEHIAKHENNNKQNNTELPLGEAGGVGEARVARK